MGLTKGSGQGLLKEMENFGKVIGTPSAKSLVHMFLATRAAVKVPGLPAKGSPVKTVAVLGGGTMGAGICVALLSAGYKVILKEINQKFADQGVLRVVDNISRMLKKQKRDPGALAMLMLNLSAQTTYAGFDRVDLVIEAALENIPLKQAIFKDLVDVCRPNCFLTTNTSTIDVNKVGELVPQARDRIAGLHFFSPAHIMPLLEIIKTEHTAPLTIKTCMELGAKLKKTSVVVGNCTGFVANRVLLITLKRKQKLY